MNDLQFQSEFSQCFFFFHLYKTVHPKLFGFIEVKVCVVDFAPVVENPNDDLRSIGETGDQSHVSDRLYIPLTFFDIIIRHDYYGQYLSFFFSEGMSKICQISRTYLC